MIGVLSSTPRKFMSPVGFVGCLNVLWVGLTLHAVNYRKVLSPIPNIDTGVISPLQTLHLSHGVTTNRWVSQGFLLYQG